MKKIYTQIENDVLDVVDRLKEIDDGYFVVYNNLSKRLEVHNSKQGLNTFCLSVPANRLDARTVELVKKTRVRNIDKLVSELDKHNEGLAGASER